MPDIRPLLIEAIKDRPPLWVTSHVHYKYRKVQDKLWNEVYEIVLELHVKSGKKYPLTVEYLKKQWKNLKDTYRKELRKPNMQWKFTEDLSFLEEEVKNSRRAGGSSPPRWGGQDASSIDIKNNLSQDEDIPCEFLETKDFEWSATRSTGDPLDSEQITDDAIYTMQPENDMRRIAIAQSTKRKSEDYHFLMSILPEMEKLPPLQKMRLRNKINAALMEEMEINYAKE